jgi:hypothetical protein
MKQLSEAEPKILPTELGRSKLAGAKKNTLMTATMPQR